MIVHVNPHVLSTAVAKLRIITRTPALNIKYAVYTLIAHDDQLDIITSDIDTMFIKVSIKAKIVESGKISVNGNQLSGAVSKLEVKGADLDVVQLVCKDNFLLLNTNLKIDELDLDISRNFQLVTFDVSRSMEYEDTDSNIRIDASTFKEIVATACNFIESKNVDYVEFSGISCRTMFPNTLIISACDGPKLIEIMADAESTEEINVILPKIICNISQGFIEPNDTIEINISDSMVKFFIRKPIMDIVVYSSLVYGEFPDFSEFFKEYPNHIIANTKQLYANIHTIFDSLSDDNYKMRFCVKENKLELSGTSSVTQAIVNKGMTVDCSGIVDIIINAHDLKTVLQHIKTEYCQINVGNPEEPIIVLPFGDPLNIEVKGLIATIIQ